MKTFKQFLMEAKETTSKYKKGEFGYWWTVIEGKEDIEGKVYDGDIYCYKQELTSLKGAPKEVSGDFYCDGNELTSLEGGPKEVKGDFHCNFGILTSLKGAPEKVGGDFECKGNKLTSLKGSPKYISRNFNCSGNKLISLEGAPKEIKNSFNCKGNKLTSLKGCPKIVGWGFDCSNNELTSLEGTPDKVDGNFDCRGNKIKSLDNLPKEIKGKVYSDIKIKDHMSLNKSNHKYADYDKTINFKLYDYDGDWVEDLSVDIRYDEEKDGIIWDDGTADSDKGFKTPKEALDDFKKFINDNNWGNVKGLKL